MRIRTALDLLRLGGYLQFLAPRPPRANTIALPDRLAGFPRRGLPLDQPVEIRWNAYQIPFIRAATDRDLAVTLGLVHAHLRLGQMEVMRRIAYGRLSEMIGPAGVEIDHALRIIDFPRAVPDILRRLPDDTRQWLSGFVAGINQYLHAASPLPHEFDLFGLRREPWRVADILAVGRLVAWDVTWLVWLRLLRAREAPGWPALWHRLIEADTAPIPEPVARGAVEAAALSGLLAINNRAGSNSFAISRPQGAQRTAWIASDPHLDLSLPSNWLVAGYESPGYHAAGLMIPGLPFIALGRNRWIGWGGTALHAITSDLADISHLPDSALDVREEAILPRWSRARPVTIRRSPAGPVLSDSVFFFAPSGRRIALRWIGHQASDEITAMLAVNRARNWAEFRAALESFAIPAQTLVYADSAGNVGHAKAAWIPKGLPAAPNDLVSPADDPAWSALLTSSALPEGYNPQAGFVVSANDRPVDTDLVIGRFFSSRDRLERLTQLFAKTPRVDFPNVARIQQDVEVISARPLAHRFAEMARSGARAPLGRRSERLVRLLAAWDGAYHAGSAGAAAFEAVLFHFARLFYPRRVFAAYAAVWALRSLIRADIEAADPHRAAPVLRKAIARAARTVRTRTWGELHRLRGRHPLGAWPLAGRRYRYFDLAASGGSETVMKTANGLAGGRHAVRYGSNARHISNLADPDANYFVLFGGQDGWFGSTTFADQVPLWLNGDYVQVPLRPDTVRRSFPFAMTLHPRTG